MPQTLYHDAPSDGPTSRRSSVDHGIEKLSGVHGIQGHPLRVCCVSQEDKVGAVSSPPRGDEIRQQRDSFGNVRMATQQVAGGLENSIAFPEQKIAYEAADLHLEKKRKVFF